LDLLAAELTAERDTMARRVGELLDVEHDYITAAARVREWMFIEKFSEEIEAVADALADSH
jgi:molecular chaperone HscB